MVVAWDDSFLHFFLLSVSMYPYLHTFHFFFFLIPCRLSFAFSVIIFDVILCVYLPFFVVFNPFFLFSCFVDSCAGSHVNNLILFLPSQLSVASYSPLAVVVS